MKALCVTPGHAHGATLEQVAEPSPADGAVLVATIGIGICGTDVEIVNGAYGWPPPGRESLIIGHEAVGRVVSAPSNAGVAPGELVVPIVRRPDPEPCRFCAAGEWDMCVNGRYTERGIKGRDGYASERFRVEPEFLVPVPAHLGHLAVLAEPASIVTKAWEHIERIGGRSRAWRPSRVLVTGAGPVGLLAALLAVQHRADVHVFDRVTSGPKPQLVAALGATYHSGDLPSLLGAADVVIECTGADAVLREVFTITAAGRIVCLVGVSAGGHESPIDLGAVNRRMVLENDVLFGSVNANRRHYEAALQALAAADSGWLARVVTRRVPIDRWSEAFERRPDDVKTVIEF